MFIRYWRAVRLLGTEYGLQSRCARATQTLQRTPVRLRGGYVQGARGVRQSSWCSCPTSIGLRRPL